jgi:transposase
MQDRQLYQQILGIAAPWSVDRVELALEEGEVRVHLAHQADAIWVCPECGKECPLHDHERERTWRHLDTCQYRTLLSASMPRTSCPDHGVRVVRVPWAEPHGRFTLLFERMVIDWLKAASQTAVAARMGLSWDEVHGIMERGVKRGLARRKPEEVPYLGVDEKSFRKGHRYVTVVNDLVGGRVLYVAKDREQSSLDGFWGTLTAEQRGGVQAVAMDMWDAYANSVRKHLKDGDEKIVYDKFHIAKHLADGVDRVRRQENKQLRLRGDETLSGTRYLWLKNPENQTEKQWKEFRVLRNTNLRTARAWALKEQASKLWDYKYEKPARKHFAWWYRWATHSRLKPMIEKAKMLKNRLKGVLTYLQHPITNAMSESINAKIQWIKYTARGFRNEDSFATAIYFHCGGLDLSPSPTQ